MLHSFAGRCRANMCASTPTATDQHYNEFGNGHVNGVQSTAYSELDFSHSPYFDGAVGAMYNQMADVT